MRARDTIKWGLTLEAVGLSVCGASFLGHAIMRRHERAELDFKILTAERRALLRAKESESLSTTDAITRAFAYRNRLEEMSRELLAVLRDNPDIPEPGRTGLVDMAEHFRNEADLGRPLTAVR